MCVYAEVVLRHKTCPGCCSVMTFPKTNRMRPVVMPSFSLSLLSCCRGPIQTEASYVQSQMGKRNVPACSKGQAVTAFG